MEIDITKSETIVHMLQKRAHLEPHRFAYIFLADGVALEEKLTYEELHRNASVLAAQLRAIALPGSRVLLFYHSGLDFVCGFFGCLYASLIAVPLTPLNPYQTPHRIATRLQGIASNAKPTVGLTTSSLLPRLQQLEELVPELSILQWISTDTIEYRDKPMPSIPPPSIERVALLQYSSGSTSAPKGIIISHQNIVENVSAIRRVFGATEKSLFVSWLPHDHDMGLISAFMEPVFGSCLVFFSPFHFIQRPARWLHAVSAYKGTISGAPNFAFDLCCERISKEDQVKFDLSTWDIAFTGAEMIQRKTLERFGGLFEENGFRRESFFPAYGLAEATLMVSGGPRKRAPNVLAVDRDELFKGRVVLTDNDGQGVRHVVGCGQPMAGLNVVVVDPSSLQPVNVGEVGEIWIAGPSVAIGYWARPGETKETFDLLPVGTKSSHRYLRSGDLGFIHNGEVFVTGRIKDVIIIRGQGYNAEDIEQTIQEAFDRTEIGGSVTFSFVDDYGEYLVVAIEKKRTATLDNSILADKVRSAVSMNHGIPIHTLHILRMGGISRTMNRKVQRHRCKLLFLSGKLNPLATFV